MNPIDGCDDTWSEDGVVLSFVNTTSDDCTTARCSFGVDDPGRVWLYPARLRLDLGGLGCDTTRVEVDVEDNCGADCTRAFAYASSVERARVTNSGGPGTLVLTPGTPIDTVAVSSCEGQVLEIRLR
jgi:hypothetical protein